MTEERPNYQTWAPDGVRSLPDDEGRYLYLKKWLEMFRPHGYATHDDSWGELEKILDIVHRNYLQLLRTASAERLTQARKTVREAGDEFEACNNALDSHGYEREFKW